MTAGRAARLILLVAALASFALTGSRLLALYRNPLVQWQVERSEAEIAAAVERLLVAEATPEALAARLEHQLSQERRNWVVIDSLEGIAADRGIVMAPEIGARIAAARQTDGSILETGKKCIACALDAAHCEPSGILLCRVPIDLTVIGDVTGVIVQSRNYVTGEPVDRLELGFSAVGLSATTLGVMSGGTSLGFKAGVGTARLAWRIGTLSPKLVARISRGLADAVDWNRVANARVTHFAEDFRAAVRPGAFDDILHTFRHVGDLRTRTSVPQTLHLLRFVDSPDDARKLAAVSRTAGTKTAGLVELAGKNRVFRGLLRWSDETWGLIRGGVAFVTFGIGLLCSIGWTVVFSALRRLARGPGRRT